MFTKNTLKLFSPRRLFILFLRPFLTAGTMLMFWRHVVTPRWAHNFPIEDSQVLANFVTMIACFHAIIAALTLATAISGRQKMYECLDQGNYIRFVQFREERIFWPVHLLLFCFSLCMVVGTMLIGYKSLITGTFVVFTTSLVITLYWEVAMVADDPLNSRWYRYEERVSDKLRLMTMAEAVALTEEEQRRRELLEGSSLCLRRFPTLDDQGIMDSFSRRLNVR